MSEKNTDELLAEVKKHLDGSTDKIKEIAQDAIGKAEKGEELSKSAKEQADELLLKHNKLQSAFDELNQKLDRGSGAPERKYTSVGEELVADEGVKSWASGGANGTHTFETKSSLMSAVGTGDGQLGAAIEPDRKPFLPQLRPRHRIKDLIAPGTTQSNSITYPREAGFTNAAAMTAEGGASQKSTIKIDSVNRPVKKISHYIHASEEVLADLPMLQGLIDTRLLWGLDDVEEKQILFGDNTGNNLFGIVPQASAYTGATVNPDEKVTRIDVLRLAMLQTYLAEIPANGHVLNPVDWTSIELLKDDVGRYVIGDPKSGLPPSLWNLPVVETQAMAPGDFLTGAFAMGAQYFDRQQSEIKIRDTDGTDFIDGMIKIRADKRGALAVYRPEGFVTGAFVSA